MKKKLLKCLLWLVSICRAALIVVCLYALYVFVLAVVFSVNMSSTEIYVIPAVVLGLVSVVIVVSDTEWVNKEYKKFLN